MSGEDGEVPLERQIPIPELGSSATRTVSGGEQYHEVAIERLIPIDELDAALNPIDMVFATIAAMESRVQAAVEDKSDYRRAGPARLKLTYLQPVEPADDRGGRVQ